MTNRPLMLCGAAMVLVFAVHGCTGSETVGGGPNGGQTTGAGGSQAGAGGSQTTSGAGGSQVTTTGAGGSQTTSGAGGSQTTSGAGGSQTTSGAGGSQTTSGAGGAQTTTGAGGSTGGLDANCNSTLAKTGALCTKDCTITCGYQALGTKVCTCDLAMGAYSMCPCPRPASFMGAATAPVCPGTGPTGGMTSTLKGLTCTTEWQQCVGRDLVSGTTPQGCVCMRDAVANTLKWVCGSTNKWFTCEAAQTVCPPPPLQ